MDRVFLKSALLGATFSLTVGAGAAPIPALKEKILPILEEHCVECHDAETAKGDLNLDLLWEKGNPAQLDLRLWWKIENQVTSGTMPPEKKDPLGKQKADAVAAWIDSAENHLAENPSGDPGFRRIRRLTRYEYNYTVRDLLGIECREGDQFPADGSGGEGFDNSAGTLFVPPLLLEKQLNAATAIVSQVFADKTAKAKLLTGDSLEEATTHLLKRAWRRNVTASEVKRFVDVAGTQKMEEGMRKVLRAILVSPEFLFLIEKNRPGADQPWPVGGFELASRLSYFLWASMPDDELFSLARSGEILKPEVLEAQTRRLLADPKSEALVEHFAGRWLDLPDDFAIDYRKHRGLHEVEDHFREEVRLFSGHILRGQGKATDFLDSRYTFLDERLAKWYGIGGVSGGWQKVSLTDHPRRGGLIGMGAIHATTSYPQRTSPVLRGKWVIEQILGTPPPPPPDDVGELPEDDRKFKNDTVRQRLEKHRSLSVCAGCHARIDPPGFALENFDPSGRWRDKENGKPIDARSVFPGGREFTGPEELRRELMARRELFVRNFCGRLLGYSLGRGLEPHDHGTLVELCRVLEEKDHRVPEMIVALVMSEPFRLRRASR